MTATYCTTTNNPCPELVMFSTTPQHKHQHIQRLILPHQSTPPSHDTAPTHSVNDGAPTSHPSAFNTTGPEQSISSPPVLHSARPIRLHHSLSAVHQMLERYYRQASTVHTIFSKQSLRTHSSARRDLTEASRCFERRSPPQILRSRRALHILQQRAQLLLRVNSVLTIRRVQRFFGARSLLVLEISILARGSSDDLI